MENELYPGALKDLARALHTVALAIEINTIASPSDIAQAMKLIQEMGYHAGRSSAFREAAGKMQRVMDELGPDPAKKFIKG